MSTDTTTIQDLAAEASTWFEDATRGDTGRDEDRYTRCKEGTPDWVRAVALNAHGDMAPDDWRYECIAAALEAIGETGDEDSADFADGYVDVYTSDRLAWLASRLDRSEYVDDAVESFGHSGQGIVGDIGAGQYQEASEVYGLVWAQLERCLEAIEDEDGEVSA